LSSSHHDHHHHDHHHADVVEFDDDSENAADPNGMPDQIRLTTVGIDIGSATTHFLLSKLTLRRLGVALMSRYEIVSKEELYRSGILFTPYRSSTEIDSDQLSAFFTQNFEQSGVGYDELDTGIVMLTGEAARKTNARAIATMFAETMGKFVCTSAGHHLEARMAASGSGALLASREAGSRIVNVDVGGGTTKFTHIYKGEILGTAALNVGGRLVAIEDGQVVRVDEAARRAAEVAGVPLILGQPLSNENQRTLSATLAGAVVEYLTKDPSEFSAFTQALLLTEPVSGLPAIDEIVLSGGVSEYINADIEETRDLGPTLAAELVAQSSAAGRTLRPAAERMRATVVGLSQFTTQLSGDTVFVSSPQATPRLNLPVVEVSIEHLGEEVSAPEVAEAIHRGLVLGGREDLLDPVAVSLAWQGKPYFRTLTAIAEGFALAAKLHLPDGALVAVLSQDCARSLGNALRLAVPADREVVCIDGLSLRSNDFIDVGAPIQNGRVIPVVVKTLVFPEVRKDSGNGGAGDPVDTGSQDPAYVEVGGQIL
jgi:ethanolamine utilization protein EutA